MKWQIFCVEKFTKLENGANILLMDYLNRVHSLQVQGADLAITKALLDYAHDKMQQLDI